MAILSINYHSIKQSRQKSEPYSAYSFRLCVVLTGGGVWHISDRDYPVKPGNIILLGPSDFRILSSIEEEGISFLVFRAEPLLLLGTAFASLFTNRPSGFSHVIQSENSIALALLAENADLSGDEKEDFLRHIFFCLLHIAKQSLLRDGTQFTSGLNPSALAVLEFLNKNFDKPKNLKASAAAAANLSENSFSRFFKKNFGVCFSQFVIGKRIEKTLELLKDKNETVLNAALSAGFGGLSEFYKALKKNGIDPPRRGRDRNLGIL